MTSARDLIQTFARLPKLVDSPKRAEYSALFSVLTEIIPNNYAMRIKKSRIFGSFFLKRFRFR